MIPARTTDPRAVFWYWVNERHRMYVKRFVNNESYPWTEDPILGEYKFTNPFRQYDRVTQELVNRIGEETIFTRRHVLLAQIIVFRMFNLPQTYDALLNGAFKVINASRFLWDEEKAKEILHERASVGKQIFTGAYIITNQGSKRPKIDLVSEAISHGLRNVEKYADEIFESQSVEKTVSILRDIPLVGGFIAYELACDVMHHTHILRNCSDRYAWANPGPGAQRGLNRIHQRPLKKKVNVPTANEEMKALLDEATVKLDPRIFDIIEKHTLFDMRAVEHSLCEFDKYSRVLHGEGRPRSRYQPPLPA